jgi:integrase
MTLADARKAAADAQHTLARGQNPAKAKADAKIKADAAKANTLTAIAENYLKRAGKDLRTFDQRVSILKRLIYPALGDKPIGSIKRSDIVAMLDKIEDRNGPRAADVVLSVLRKIMRWHATRDDEFTVPIVPGMNRQKATEHQRDRVLNDDELRRVWQAATPEQPFGALIRLALLTSARRGELAGMKWDEVGADGVWTLPTSRSKIGKEIARPLSKAALTILDELPRIDGCPFVFTTTGRTPIKQFSLAKEKLDAASGTSGWTIHDLRRTARSLMSRAGVGVDIAERCLGHAMPTIRATYDKHQYIEEMRHGFGALAAQIESIINPPVSDVADMAAERSKRRR